MFFECVASVYGYVQFISLFLFLFFFNISLRTYHKINNGTDRCLWRNENSDFHDAACLFRFQSLSDHWRPFLVFSVHCLLITCPVRSSTPFWTCLNQCEFFDTSQRTSSVNHHLTSFTVIATLKFSLFHQSRIRSKKV